MSSATPRALGGLALLVIYDEHRTIRQEIVVGFWDGPLPIKQWGGKGEEPAKQEDRRQENPKQQDLLIHKIRVEDHTSWHPKKELQAPF
jgi:hypothetical protein